MTAQASPVSAQASPVSAQASMDPIELAHAMRSLSTISESLVATYSELADRAERVERELSAANAELAKKVDELAATRAHLEAVLQALPTGVVVRDPDGRIARVNGAACSILGATPSELVGRRSHPYLDHASADGEEREIERASGDRLVLATRRSLVRGPDGEVRGSVELLDDRTSLVELDERLHRLDKMAALGTMAGGIAHEIRNPMNAMQGFAELLKRELAPDTKAYRFSARIAEGVAEADAIIANLLSFAQPERLRAETIDAESLVRDAIEAASTVIAQDADRSAWRVTSDVRVESFVADRIKIRQALRNLVANAIQAQPKGGAIHVEVRLDGTDVVLRVTDAGPGIPRKLRQRVADPFFTTRAEGTGLGLCLVSTVARLHGGRLEVSPDNAPCGGADILIRFPNNPAS